MIGHAREPERPIDEAPGLVFREIGVQRELRSLIDPPVIAEGGRAGEDAAQDDPVTPVAKRPMRGITCCPDANSEKAVMYRARRLLSATIMMLMAAQAAAEASERGAIPSSLSCKATQTAGFHDYPHNEEAYESVVFFESTFRLSLNRVLMRHLAADSPFDAFLTLITDEGELVELNCSRLKGLRNASGISCSNTPPSDLLLLNLDNLRFTRTAIGGWTFTGADESTAGESIYVEYGQCTAD